MSKPYDATLKALVETCPADWPAFLGEPAESVEVVDADVSTVTAATDKVLLVHTTDGDYIQHHDFQASPDATVPRRVHGYSALLEDRHELPVESVVILLRRQANLTAINGRYQRALPGRNQAYLSFEYRVLRVCEEPPERFLSAGLSLLPLAPLADLEQGELPTVIREIKQRLDQVELSTAGELWTATRILMGLSFPQPTIEQLLQGVMGMKESVSYQAIVEEGRIQGLTEGRTEGQVEEARRLLLRLGQHLYKVAPNAQEQATLDAIGNVERLEELALAVTEHSCWADLLGLAPPGGKGSRRKKS